MQECERGFLGRSQLSPFKTRNMCSWAHGLGPNQYWAVLGYVSLGFGFWVLTKRCNQRRLVLTSNLTKVLTYQSDFRKLASLGVSEHLIPVNNNNENSQVLSQGVLNFSLFMDPTNFITRSNTSNGNKRTLRYFSSICVGKLFGTGNSILFVCAHKVYGEMSK